MAENNKVNTYFANSIFNDIDQYSEVVKQWDIDFAQLDTGKLEAKMIIMGDTDFHVLRTSYNKAFLQNGSSPKNLISFGIPIVVAAV